MRARAAGLHGAPSYLLRSPENARRLLASIDGLEHGGGIERDLLG